MCDVGSQSRGTLRTYKNRIFERKTGKEIHEKLCEACDGSAVLFNTMYRWLKRFSTVILDTSDDQRSGGPIELTTFHTEKKIKECLNGDRRYTSDETAESFGISHRSVYTILTRHLIMRRVAVRWVPHHLTRDQMTDRVEKAKRHLTRYTNEGNQFWNRIVATDET